MPTPEQEAILSQLQERYGSAAVPRVDDLDKLPSEFWQQASTHLAEGSGGDEPMWKRVLSTAYRTPINPVGHLLPETDGGKPFSIEHLWNTVRPPLERAEEIGQLVGSPIVQAVKENPASLLPGGQSASQAMGQKTLAERYVDAGRGYAGAVKTEDGLDLRGATKEATDAMELSRYVAGLSGVLFDPLNLVPGSVVTKGPKAVGRVVSAAEKGIKPGAAQAAQEVAGAVKGYPGAIVEEGQQIERLAEGVGKTVKEAVKLPAYALVGAGGGGPGRAVDKTPKLQWVESLYPDKQGNYGNLNATLEGEDFLKVQTDADEWVVSGYLKNHFVESRQSTSEAAQAVGDRVAVLEEAALRVTLTCNVVCSSPLRLMYLRQPSRNLSRRSPINPRHRTP